jgi:hypothetical protein
MPGAFPLETELDVHLARLTALVNLISTKAEPLPHAGALRVITEHRQEVEEAMAALGGWILDFEAARPALEAAQAARQKLTAPLHAWAQTGPAHSRSIAVPPRGREL